MGGTLTAAGFHGPLSPGAQHLPPMCAGLWAGSYLTKIKFLVFPFKRKGFFFISIHKKKKKRRKNERKLPLTNGKNNPVLCLLAQGPVMRARLWTRGREILMDSSRSTHSCLCFSEVNLGPLTPQYFTLVTVPTIRFQIAGRAEVLESYHPH